MRTQGALAAGALLVGAACAASTPPGVVRWDISRRDRRQELARLGKRADTYEEVITNEEMRGGYFATCQIGTPGQDLTLQLDTGSSDIWVPASTAQVCSRRGDRGCSFGSCMLSMVAKTYLGRREKTNLFGAVNPDESETFEVVGEGNFDISYVDTSYAKGDYFTDVFEIGGAVIQNMTMGLGSDTDINHGLVGVGYPQNEAIVGTTQSLRSMYPNLPIQMVNEGLINTAAYSLWLNDLGELSHASHLGGSEMLTTSQTQARATFSSAALTRRSMSVS
jgi:hypothetical protein